MPQLVLMAIGVALLILRVGDSGAKADTVDHLLRIHQTGEVRICIWPDYYGISYRNPKTMEITGIDADLARELAQDLGPQTTVRFVDSSFSQLVEDVNSDRCDLAMFAIAITPNRQQTLRFCQPHLQSDVYAITTQNNRRIQQWSDIDQPGIVVAVAKGTLHEPLMRDRLTQAQLVVLDTPFAREQEVESGRADVFMTDYPYSQRLLANSDWARRIAPPRTYHVLPYAVAMAFGDDRWYQRVEQFIGKVKYDGRLLDICRRYRLEAIVKLDELVPQ